MAHYHLCAQGHLPQLKVLKKGQCFCGEHFTILFLVGKASRYPRQHRSSGVICWESLVSSDDSYGSTIQRLFNLTEKSCFFEWKKKHWISSHYDKIQKIFSIRGQCKIQINDNNDEYCNLLIQIIIAHDEVNVHCSPAKEVFFHNSQLDNDRLLEKSQNPRDSNRQPPDCTA